MARWPRPRLVQGLATLAAAMAASGATAAGARVAQLEHFVDELTVPPRITLSGPGPFERTITLGQIQAQIHRDLPPVPVWAYDGSSPGPTIEVDSNATLSVHWQNSLPTTHVFAAPENAEPIQPDVRSVTHLHGAVVAEPDPNDRERNDDGWPDAWITPGQSQLAVYPNPQSARTLWYHDHAMGETGRNVAAGLVGAYEIHDDYERSLNLPSGAYDIPLLIQSKQVNDDGTLGYTDDVTAEFWGNATAVNGKLWPYLQVEPRKYRFRIVNTANARTFAMKLVDRADGRTAGPALYQIGSDAGFLEHPAVLNDPSDSHSPRLTLAPSERADVIIDFSQFAGRELVLTNNSHDPADDEISIPDVMMFRVGPAVSAPDPSTLPQQLAPIEHLIPEEAVATRRVVFDQMSMDGMTMLTLNGKHWHDPVEERPVLGTTEVWELANTLIGTHPFHMHLVQFQVLDRRLFDVASYIATGEITYLADPVPPAPNEQGWKDTVRAQPQMVTRIIMRFAPFPGYYVYHCHILEHEDMDMMRPFQVVAE